MKGRWQHIIKKLRQGRAIFGVDMRRVTAYQCIGKSSADFVVREGGCKLPDPEGTTK